jgi:pimeloyl-ACP methyl ester carboxylesterase
MPANPQANDREATINGLQLQFRDWGGEAPLSAIAMHGFALNAHSFDEVAPALNEQLRIFALDQRGHGDSAWAAELRDYTRDNMVADIRSLIAKLALERPILIGHSMGGINAMTLAGRYPDLVRALILIDVGPETSVDGAQEVRQFVAGPYAMESLDAWVDHTHKYYPHRSTERIRARLAVSLRETKDGRLAKQFDERFRKASFRGITRADDDIWDVARAVSCPTLLLHGEMSPVLKRENAEAFAQANQHVELVTIAKAGHSIAGDQPEAFVAEVSQFLASLGANT